MPLSPRQERLAELRAEELELQIEINKLEAIRTATIRAAWEKWQNAEAAAVSAYETAAKDFVNRRAAINSVFAGTKEPEEI